MRKFEVVSKVFGAGVLSIGDSFDWSYTGQIAHKGEYSWIHLKGTWRVLSAECPAEWHKEQAGMGMEDREDPFLTPPGKWLTIVTDIGEVIGFEIVRDAQ